MTATGADIPSVARAARRQISPVPLAGVAAGPVMRQWNCAASREAETAREPSQVQGQFRALHRDSYPEGYGCYCPTRTQRCDPVGPPHQKARPPGAAGRGRRAAQRGAGESGKARKTSSLGRREKRVTQLHVQSNLRVKRSDPSHGANARPKAGAVPVVKVPARNADDAGVPAPVRRASHRQVAPNRAKRPHSTDPAPERDGTVPL